MPLTRAIDGSSVTFPFYYHLAEQVKHSTSDVISHNYFVSLASRMKTTHESILSLHPFLTQGISFAFKFGHNRFVFPFLTLARL